MNTNALAAEKSPYLRQHAENPVDWLPWGPAAFDKAKKEDKPIFLSIGYSTCHWCHVMAHESFENKGIAAVLNRDFIPVKLDREERPDVDRVYMLFVQATTGSGGWPMSVWLTPDLKPFFGGTYFPPDSRYGRPGFLDVLTHISRSWRDERMRINESSIEMLEQLGSMTGSVAAPGEPDKAVFVFPYQAFRRSYDGRYGGFGSAPKFPRPSTLNYLIRYYAETSDPEALEMVTGTLNGMARGGIHDHLGGGFHRYSVDGRWFVPHFEKMLYDQAQLAVSYVEAYQVTGEQSFAGVAAGILDYVRRDMTHPDGGFYSAEDADSPDPDDPAHSREGAFYVWTAAEIDALLTPEQSAILCQHYGVKTGGNVQEDPHAEFAGRNILFLAAPVADARTAALLAECRRILLTARSKRPRPHLDDKILTGWNGMMISAFAKAAGVVGREDYLAAAERAASFLLTHLYDPSSGTLLRRWAGGEAAIPAFLDDYALTAQAVLDLFEATGKASYLKTSLELAKRAVSLFEDPANGGFYSTAEGASDLVMRVKDDYDGAEPSGNSAMTDVLLRLAHLLGDENLRQPAVRSLRAFAPKLTGQPSVAPQLTVALGRALAEAEQVVIRCASPGSDTGSKTHDLAAGYRRKFTPWGVTLILTDEEAARLQAIAPFLGSLKREGSITLYECRNFACQLPEIIS